MNKLNPYIRLLSIHNPYSYKLAIVRTLLALSTLLTLIFNSSDSIFSVSDVTQICTSGIKELSIYCLFSNIDFAIPRVASIIILIVVIIGVYPRVTGVLHWWVSFSFFVSTPYVDGGDQVASILTFFLIPVTLLDSRKSHWKKGVSSPLKNLAANFIIRVIRIQVCIIYLHAAAAKFNVPEWIDGTVVYYWFTHNTFGVNLTLQPIILPIIENNFLVFSITWATLILESSLFAGIFASQRIRLVLLQAGIIFHFLIFIIHGLGSFGLAITAALILYLSPIHKEFNLKVKRFKPASPI